MAKKILKRGSQLQQIISFETQSPITIARMALKEGEEDLVF